MAGTRINFGVVRIGSEDIPDRKPAQARGGQVIYLGERRNRESVVGAV